MGRDKRPVMTALRIVATFADLVLGFGCLQKRFCEGEPNCKGSPHNIKAEYDCIVFFSSPCFGGEL